MTPSKASYDAIVVGARCAGAATAMLLARQGLDVLLIDRGRYGTDTNSTHALMRGAILQLHRWGLLERLQAEGTPLVPVTTFHYGDEAIRIQIKPRSGIPGLYAPRRTVLDRLLVDAAEEASAEVRYGQRLVRLLRSGDGPVTGVELEDRSGDRHEVGAGVVIGADGRKSTVARLTGALTHHRGRHATGVIYGYWSGLPLDGYHWYFRPGVSAGAIPTNDGQTLVFVSVPEALFRRAARANYAAAHARFIAAAAPELGRQLSQARQVGSLRGFPGAPGFLRQSHGPGWALVGDAGYFKDPITAHGITDALRDAELLSRAVLEGTDRALADYQAQRDTESMPFFEVTDAIASFAWDLETVKQYHLTMSDEMKREVARLVELDRESFRAA